MEIVEGPIYRNRELTAPIRLFLGFDFEAYGKRRCEEEGIILTSYGSITCVKEQVEEQIEKQTEASREEPTEDLGKGSEREEAESMDLRMGM